MNPFRFGTAVKKPYFVGRSKELSNLLTHVNSLQNVLVFGDRKIGKTSLLMTMADHLKKDHLFIYVDLWGVKNSEDFCVRLLGSIGKLQSFKSKMTKLLASIKSMRPNIALSTDGTPQISYSLAPKQEEVAIEEVMGLLAKIIDRKKAVVVFDEFQEINSFDRKNDHFELKGKLRSVIQFHQNISYIYCGSQQHILLDMFDLQTEPFYASALKFPMASIPLDDFTPYIKAGFEINNISITDQLIQDIFNLAEGTPNSVQQLSYFVFGASQNNLISRDAINDGLNQLLNAETPRFNSIFRQLSKPQQNLIKAMSEHDSKKLYSQDTIQKYKLKSTQAVRDSILALIKKDIIYKCLDTHLYKFKITWFKLWLKKHHP